MLQRHQTLRIAIFLWFLFCYLSDTFGRCIKVGLTSHWSSPALICFSWPILRPVSPSPITHCCTSAKKNNIYQVLLEMRMDVALVPALTGTCRQKEGRRWLRGSILSSSSTVLLSQGLLLHQWRQIYCFKIVSLVQISSLGRMTEIWVFHDRHFCQIIWQIQSYTEQNKFRQKLPPVGIHNLQTISLMLCQLS